MKVKIGKYKSWIGPYQIAEKLLFWKDPDDVAVTNLFEWLDNSWVRPFCEWVHSKNKRTVKVKIDHYDVWNMDCTLAYIILPMLKELKKEKMSSPFVENSDVPEHLRDPNSDNWEKDETIHERWAYVLDEMIYAFQSYETENDFPFFNQEKSERINNGLRLFGKYYRGLWT